MLSQDRQKKVSAQLESFLAIAKEAERLCTERVSVTVASILLNKLGERKTQIQGGLYGRPLYNILQLGSLANNQSLRNLGESAKEKIAQQDKEIRYLEEMAQEAQKMVQDLPFEKLVEIVQTLRYHGIEIALNQILGPNYKPPSSIGKYRLERVQRKELKVNKDSDQDHDKTEQTK